MNELRILPLRRYEVAYLLFTVHGQDLVEDVFTADFHDVTEDRRTRFYRTGNVIREYHTNLLKIVVTPVDDEDVPK